MSSPFRFFSKFSSYFGFIAISILALPFTLTIQFLTVHCVTTQSRFLPLFARVHRIAKTVLYTTIELFKRIPLGVIGLVRYKHATARQFLFLYAYVYIGCMTSYILHTQWMVFRTVLLSGDVETKPPALKHLTSVPGI